ncbi:PhaM family polyhydroxyalkanoate granule multifunctional regulatory protein [Pusillimonas minor]|uniref:Transcriptional regulator n=1 Tax=Pusillimonas minor TaxID=2697024 RepID=A0A842HT41_9BURK|nr:PhaM family polyhydroxyalkanoate granule multifunctional regulatory protein [Pusillimonas minor]MBC2769985.1 transcriptional regulator [Pusillimonas minor]
MTNTNPFVLPGFGQSGDMAQNPMMASMEMMRQAWQNLAGAGAGALSAGTVAAPPMSLEELDRRITELRTVENWLRMNLSMLGSTIQGMEVQRATIATLKSFVSPAAAGNDDAPSALEVALGLKPSGQAKIKPASEAPRADTAGAASSDPVTSGSGDNWWNMLQQQFDTLASATAASMKNAESAVSAATQAATDAATKASTSSSVSSGLAAMAAASPAAGAPKPRAARKSASAKKTTASGRAAPRKRAARTKASS